ncbi:DNA replication complex GINS family protein [Candidatus Pacearchaeota archaeon]|nr:DNA replication complex GINS family protein [Candidatus Pacearchaeota archaeon]
MITYNDIYELLRKEKYTEQLQPIPKNFISEFASYIKEKRKIAMKNDEQLFSDAITKSKKQFENAVVIFKELLLRRKKKILNLSFIAAETGISKKDFENMLAFEKVLFDKIMGAIEIADKDVSDIVNGKLEDTIKNSLVIFMEKTEEFLDPDGKKLGPYKEGDIANLPKDIAKILFESKKVSYLDSE